MRVAVMVLLAMVCGGAAPATQPDQAKVDAAKAKLAARQAAREADDNAPSTMTKAQERSLRKELADLRAEVGRLRLELAKAAPEKPSDAIARAIQEKRLAIGMTVEQAEKAMGGKGKLIREEAGSQTFLWQTSQYVNEGGRLRSVTGPEHYGVFENGRLVRLDNG